MSERRRPFTYVDHDGREIAWNAEPESLAAARAERFRLAQDVKDISVQLDVAYWSNERDDPTWRKRAMWARRDKERRAEFLAEWIAERERVPATMTAAAALASLTGAIAVLDGVRRAAERFVDEDSDEAYAELVKRLEQAKDAA